MYGQKPHLSLAQHFTAAVMAVTLGVAAAAGANATIVPVLDAVYYTPLTAFAVNFTTLFAVAGGAAGYIEQSIADYNRTRPRLQPWALPAQDWWDKKGGP